MTDVTIEELERDGYDLELKTYLRTILSEGQRATTPAGNVTMYGQFVSLPDVMALLLEAYEQAIQIGYETKVLDSLARKLRETEQPPPPTS